MVWTDRKMYTCRLCYLCLTTIVKPLNVIWMLKSTCSQTKVLDQIYTYQVIATPTINYSTNLAILDEEKHLEQIMALKFVHLLNLCTQNTLNKDWSVVCSACSTINCFSMASSSLGLVNTGPIGFPNNMTTSHGPWPGPWTRTRKGVAFTTPNVNRIG
jgi:hypothetical protein